jgi:hypothetical protein
VTGAQLRDRLAAFASIMALVVAAFMSFVRPWYLTWGATPEEQRRILPGDAIVADAAGQTTRAITIDAPIERVWPWLAQLGRDRGGFYSYDQLENLFGCEMPTDDVPRPTQQSWAIGDKLWMYPATKAGGIGFATLRAYAPGRAMGFGTRMSGTPIDAPENGSWSFVVEPIDATRSRLIVRGRGTGERSILGEAFDHAIFEPAHFVMERRMMIGLKQIVETGDRHRAENLAHIVLWTLLFGLFVGSSVAMLAGGSMRRTSAGVAGSAIVFQILTFTQPPIAVAAILTIAAFAVVVFPS